MPSHRAPSRRADSPARSSRTAWSSWRLLLPACVVTAVMVVSMVLLPGDDQSGTVDQPTSAAAQEVAATHTPGVSRSDRRDAGRGLKARKARPLDNSAARHGVAVVQERHRQARIAARKAKEKAKRMRRLARIAAMEKTSSFRVGALNILGSQHTAGPGGYGPGTDRAAMAAGLVMSRGIDVITMSEVQDDQLAVLNSRLAGYSIWPQQSLGSNGQRLQIAWRASQFEMVDGGSVTFTFASQAIPMPWVRLKDLGTGAEFYVISIHTSAGRLQGERDAGTAIAINLMKSLMAQTGDPVIIGGDVNEHTKFFYNVCNATGFLAANGGGAGCTLPPPPLRVDWIMGGGGNGVSFSGYVQDGATLARISDHYMIHADVSVTSPGDTP
ncbi:hypothetical protein EUA93_00785 [Nocardioides oleivorans]|uniref:Endonuclease/exonuclease/phosphatase domain-containing protein n=1 Tax=Nocardioides oleivorans TaxID=273676 RepID=A0A4Q2RYB2_9ACTN|nr:hypothetical protein [Nocardioides oleivorans]RYB93015.1 hypothetical protein EUA93_00785 [Nocardioides oleivorans]